MNYRELKLNYSVKQRAALTISYIFMPTSFALAAFLSLSLMTRQGSDVFRVASLSVLFGALLPLAYLLYLLHREKVTRLDVPLREQRTIPYLIAVLIYFAGFAALIVAEASVQVYSLMFCYATNTLAVTAINTKWKISAHAMGASGPLTALAITFGTYVLPLFLLVVPVAWARLELKAHTRSQVTAGAVLGILLTGVQVEAFYKIAGAH